jgi:hypothetical protein
MLLTCDRIWQQLIYPDLTIDVRRLFVEWVPRSAIRQNFETSLVRLSKKARPFKDRLQKRLVRFRAVERIGEIVWGTVAADVGVQAVALIVGNVRSRLVDPKLLPVGPQPVAVGLGIGEKSGLQHLVWTRLQ